MHALVAHCYEESRQYPPIFSCIDYKKIWVVVRLPSEKLNAEEKQELRKIFLVLQPYPNKPLATMG